MSGHDKSRNRPRRSKTYSPKSREVARGEDPTCDPLIEDCTIEQGWADPIFDDDMPRFREINDGGDRDHNKLY